MLPRRCHQILRLTFLVALFAFAVSANAQVLKPTPTPDASMAAPAAAPNDTPADASISADRNEAGIGESIKLTLHLPLQDEPKDISADLPEQQKDQFFLGPLNRVSGNEYTMDVRPLSAGDVFFGPLEIKATPVGSDQKLTFHTKRLNFTIAAPPGKPTKEVADYTTPLALAFNYFWRNIILVAGIFVGLIILGVLIFFLGRWTRKRAEAAKHVPALPPIEQALRSITDLKSLDVFHHHGAEQHYTSLSTVVRRYLEYQFNVAALEMTEDEICDLLRFTLVYLPDTEILRDVLRRTSLAKFARQPLTESDARQDCDVVEGFLVKEKRRLDEERMAALQRQREQQAARDKAGQQEDRAA